MQARSDTGSRRHDKLDWSGDGGRIQREKSGLLGNRGPTNCYASVRNEAGMIPVSATQRQAAGQESGGYGSPGTVDCHRVPSKSSAGWQPECGHAAFAQGSVKAHTAEQLAGSRSPASPQDPSRSMSSSVPQRSVCRPVVKEDAKQAIAEKIEMAEQHLKCTGARFVRRGKRNDDVDRLKRARDHRRRDSAPSADLARDLAHHASAISSRCWTDLRGLSNGVKQDVRSSGAAYGLSRGLNSLGDTSD
ncbi:hypothetical protein Purlil1_12113 [Purpureocillium lilacinum]|uniref:Uncharacterized protein n=1 Tax=Purpureocillium lilacinum TaxID=33203 RepID=A0ABR0BIH4_PURLI|nr:hypothetical protein Purlil1_12113 [Purpureocillium lilacinum]